MSIFRLSRRFFRDSNGATAIEYGLIAALLAVSIIVSAETLGNNIGNLFMGVNNNLENAVK